MKKIVIKIYDEGYFVFYGNGKNKNLWCNWETKNNGLAIRKRNNKIICFYEGAQFMCIKNTYKLDLKNIYLICG